MATPPDPNLRDMRSELSRILSAQGDYNDLLRDSIRELSNMHNAYRDINSRIESMNSGTINIKELNQEILQLTQKEKIAGRNLQDIERNLSDVAKSNLEIVRLRGLSYGDAISYLEQQGNLEAIAAYHAEEALKISQKETQNAENKLKTEKKVAKQLGVTGNLAKMLADKLGVGEEAYAAMVERSRELIDAQGEVTNPSKWRVAWTGIKTGLKAAIRDGLVFDPAVVAAGFVSAFTKAKNALMKIPEYTTKAINSVAGGPGLIQSMTSRISDLIGKLPLVGGILSSIVDTFSALLDFATGATSQVQKMGRELGLSRAEAISLNNTFSDYANNTNNVLLNSRKLFETQLEIGKSLGVNNLLSKDILQTSIQMKEVAGIEDETRKSIVESSIITGKSMGSITKSVFAQVKGLQQATGVAFDYRQTLKEASSQGGYLGLQFAKYPAQLTKSLLTTKSIGLELKQLDSMADSFLDFESSISKEFEAQLLTGKEINLAKSRELFLNNDLAGAALEINRQVGSANDFLKLNRIQAESMAQAFGMSRDQMGEMLKNQEMLSKLGAKDTDNAQKQYQLGLRRYGSEKAMAEAIGDQAYNNLMNATAQEKIAGFIEKIKQGFADLITNSGLMTFVDKAIEFLSKPDSIQGIVNTVKDIFGTIVSVLGTIIGGTMRFLNMLPGIDIDESMIDMVEGAGAKVKSANLGSLGAPAPAIGPTAAKERLATTTPQQAANDIQRAPGSTQGDIVTVVNFTADGEPIAKVVHKNNRQNTNEKTEYSRLHPKT